MSTETARISAELQCLQRQRAWHLKTRNMVTNRLQATVAGTLGYNASMKEADRRKLFIEAGQRIKEIVAGTVKTDIDGLVLTTATAIEGFDRMKTQLEKEMVKLAKQLPVKPWVEHHDRRGFGPLFLAIVIGETGDLANYANPGKVWRRLGLAPWSFDGKTLMGATWRGGKSGKLPASEWEAFGYSPRRRSISYLIGEGIVKQNAEGPYRRRYDETKAAYKAKNPKFSDLRCHRHGMLLATKLLVKELWIEWNGGGESNAETERWCAALCSAQ